MELFTLILALAELITIIVLVIVVIKQRRALFNHVKKLKRTFASFKESLEQQIEKVSNHKEIDELREEIKNILESHQRVVGDKIQANQVKYENAVLKISERLGDSLEKVSGTRVRIAEEIRRFSRILGAALKGEEELIRALGEPTDSDSEKDKSASSSGEGSSE